MTTENENNPSRREFLTTAASASTAVGVVATSVMPTTAHGMARILGANERIAVAHVGVGSQGFGAHARLIKQAQESNNTQQIAVCDLYSRRLRNAQKFLGLSDTAAFKDYRKLLAMKDVDAVVIATSDNWHADIAVDALKAGKHVYVEKPLCKTLEETFRIYDTVKRTGKVLQIGSQGTSDPKYAAVGKLVRSGKYGTPVVAQGNYMRGDNRIGEWNSYGDSPYRAPHDQAGPAASGDGHIDWETFRKGQGPKDFDADRFFRWRKYWAYGSGLVGDLLPHKLHPLFIAMGLSTEGMNGWPIRVSSGGGLYVQKNHPHRPGPDRDVPDFIYITADYPDFSLMAMSSTANEQGWPDSVRLNKAYITFTGNRIEVKPEREYAEEVEASNEEAPGSGEPIEGHQKNWFDCIRSGKTPNGNIELAARVQTVISLAERAYRENKTFTFDPKTRTATANGANGTAADKMMKPANGAAKKVTKK